MSEYVIDIASSSVHYALSFNFIPRASVISRRNVALEILRLVQN